MLCISEYQLLGPRFLKSWIYTRIGNTKFTLSLKRLVTSSHSSRGWSRIVPGLPPPPPQQTHTQYPDHLTNQERYWIICQVVSKIRDLLLPGRRRLISSRNADPSITAGCHDDQRERQMNLNIDSLPTI